MSKIPFDFTTLLGHTVKGIAASAIVGAGALVLNTARTQAVHSTQIEQLQHESQQIEKLGDKLDQTNQNLDRLIGRLDGAADVARNGK